MRFDKTQVVTINSHDRGGGAAKVAHDLHTAFCERNIDSLMIVGRKLLDSPRIVEIPNTPWYRFINKIERRFPVKGYDTDTQIVSKITRLVSNPLFYFYREMGLENYYYPESRRIIKSYKKNNALFHFHNLHKNYFDLTFLPSLSKSNPVIITMHDEYLYTGHCASTFDCTRWQIGCGKCPHLSTYPAVKRDCTRLNWKRKKNLFSQSKIVFVSPSNWLANNAKKSFLGEHRILTIPNGIDLKVFHRGPKIVARRKLSLPSDAFILLYTANIGRRNLLKDYAMLDRVFNRLSRVALSKKIILLALGGNEYVENETNGMRYIEKPYVSNAEELSWHYQACDLYIHTSKADNFPLVILEAMACGKPVVSTAVGGIPEQVRDGINGYVVPLGDDKLMAARVCELLTDENVLNRMGENSYEIATKEYSFERQVDAYLELYEEILQR